MEAIACPVCDETGMLGDDDQDAGQCFACEGQAVITEDRLSELCVELASSRAEVARLRALLREARGSGSVHGLADLAASKERFLIKGEGHHAIEPLTKIIAIHARIDTELGVRE